jgi:hypothetical protein
MILFQSGKIYLKENILEESSPEDLTITEELSFFKRDYFCNLVIIQKIKEKNMFAKIILAGSIILAPFFFSFAQHSFVGAETCGMCHKSEKAGQQLSIWQNSKHAQAYKTLLTEKADKIAKEKGFETKAVETAECLKCHVSGSNVDASMLTAKFKIEDGVQCETCHGPGSDYKSMKVMKSKDDAVAKGLLIYDKPEEFCITCHNAESPTYVDFDFATYWAKIKHNKPE